MRKNIHNVLSAPKGRKTHHIIYMFVAPVAQLDRAFACGAKGRRFESCRVYQNKKRPLGRFLLLKIVVAGVLIYNEK